MSTVDWSMLDLALSTVDWSLLESELKEVLVNLLNVIWFHQNPMRSFMKNSTEPDHIFSDGLFTDGGL